MLNTGTIYVLKTQKSLLKATTMITGPNNARHVVWALGERFLFRIFYTNLCFISVLNMYATRYVLGRAGTTKPGPNDAKCVIWTLGELILLFLRVFSH